MCAACLAPPPPLHAEFYCRLCRTPFANAFPLDASNVCAACRAGLRGFDAAYCLASYEGPFRQLIHLFKYGRLQPLRHPLSRMLAAALPRDARFDAVTSVPLHWRRRYHRGFNQSELLARGIAQIWGAPYRPMLRRVRPTASQAALTNARRRTNIAGAFRLRRSLLGGVPVAGHHVLLVDDVMTTGATARACAAVLRRAGARSVTLLTLARVDRRMA